MLGAAVTQNLRLLRRSPAMVYAPSGYFSGTSDWAKDGAGGRSTLIGGSVVASGSGPMEAPDALPDWHPAPRTDKAAASTMQQRSLLVIIGLAEGFISVGGRTTLALEL